jgi:hypothetical protein
MKTTTHERKNNNLCKSLLTVVAITVTAVLTSSAALAQDVPVRAATVKVPEKHYSPYVRRNIPDRVLWGDTHLHTSLSPDAGLTGTTLGPYEAFRFARGEVVTSTGGLEAQLRRPHDFLVVSDHAEYLGIAMMIRAADPALLADPVGKRWYDQFRKGGQDAIDAALDVVADIGKRDQRFKSPDAQRTSWETAIEAAERYNEPGKFTAFIGFEWTAMPNSANLHRVVVFRDGGDRARRVLPFSAFDSEDPEDLWRYLSTYQQETGGRVLAIAHNGNVSAGLMFSGKTLGGKPFDRAYAEQRMKWEPLYEVTQIKGDGETTPVLSPTDEFADFETWDTTTLGGDIVTTPEMLRYNYARSALRMGLQHEARLGVNPFKFGMIGSTDSHTALSTPGEENFFGKIAPNEPSPERWEEVFWKATNGDPRLATYGYSMGAGGYAAVWARKNTREAIFDAMQKKEVYATTGTRILVRVFAGWDFRPEEVQLPDFADQGYARGVPMGGELTDAPQGAAPAFMVRALRDVDGANLDRIQIVKGWLDAEGETHEKVLDVALSNGRRPDPRTGKAPSVGNTVDVANATWANTIGSPLLDAYWKDPEFDAIQKAFYYVRVIEIPTPRWTAYDAKRFGITMRPEVPMTVTERAYTSPIWYTPRS